LALTAIEKGSIGENFPHDFTLTVVAGLTLTSVDIEDMLEVTCLPLRIDKVPESTPTLVDGTLKHVLQIMSQFPVSLTGNPSTGSIRTYTRTPSGFIGIDVSDPSHDPTIEEKVPQSSRFFSGICVEVVSQSVSVKVFIPDGLWTQPLNQGVGFCLGSRPGHDAESPRIVVSQLTITFQIPNDMIMLAKLLSGICDSETSGHAEMDQ
jgi:hypothetical protein